MGNQTEEYLKTIARYCELKMELEDLEDQVAEKRETEKMEEEERAKATAKFKALSPSEKEELFSGIKAAIVKHIEEQGFITVEGILNSECEEVTDYLGDRDLLGFFAVEDKSIDDFVEKLEDFVETKTAELGGVRELKQQQEQVKQLQPVMKQLTEAARAKGKRSLKEAEVKLLAAEKSIPLQRGDLRMLYLLINEELRKS